VYPTAIVVRAWSEDTVNAIEAPCAVVPLHWPTLSDEADGGVGPPPHADASTPANVPTQNTAFVCVHIATRPCAMLDGPSSPAKEVLLFVCPFP
jgi:hypothetical protein